MNSPLLKKSYCWFAVYVKYQHEKKICEKLNQTGIEAYVPFKKELRQWSDRKKLIEIPLIPNYVFVRISPKEHYTVLVCEGALSYVSFEGKAAVIPDYQIDDMKSFLKLTPEFTEVTTSPISKGDFVRVSCGPLKNSHGEIVEIRGRKKLLLRMGTLGCNIYTELGQNKVEIIRKKENFVRH